MKKSIQVTVPVLLIYIELVTTGFAFAGTSQIYSPAGLPRSSKRYSTLNTFSNPETFPKRAPTRIETGKQNFTPAILRHEITTKSSKNSNGDGKQQTKTPSDGASGSRVNDNSGSATSSLGGSASSLNSGSSSVQSLFQCDGPNSVITPEAAAQNKSLFGSAGKLMWHTLDNIGVPMIMSRDNGLDPSLRKAYSAQPQDAFKETKSEIIHQKLPQSDCEGTDVPANNDRKSL